jgi:hypothetical protein
MTVADPETTHRRETAGRKQKEEAMATPAWLFHLSNLSRRQLLVLTGSTAAGLAFAGRAVPKGVIWLKGSAGMSELTIEPLDPVPGQSYVIRARTICAPAGTQLILSIAGSDNYSNSTTITLSETVKEAALRVLGAMQGTRDTITVELSGPVTDIKTYSVIF